MPNDVVLDPTVHHLFAKDRFNRGKSSRSWPLYPRCGHNLSPPRCPPFVEAGTPDLLWLFKSQRKAWKRGGFWRRNPEKQSNQPRKTEHTKHNPKQIQSQERKTGVKTKAKTPEQRNNTQREGEERNPVYTENCSRYCLHLCRRPCIKKPNTKPRSRIGRRSQHRPQFIITRTEKAGKNKEKREDSGHRSKGKQE
ncbi:hypothetical protein Peur_026689 [Populus x canadensis]